MAETVHAVGTPYALKTATVKLVLAGDATNTIHDFSDHVDTIEYDPTAASNSWTACNGKSISETSMATWSMTLGLVQDLHTNGLMRYILSNEGKKATFLITLKTGGDPIKIVAVLSPGKIGTKTDGNIATTTVKLACDGAPNIETGLTLP